MSFLLGASGIELRPESKRASDFLLVIIKRHGSRIDRLPYFKKSAVLRLRATLRLPGFPEKQLQGFGMLECSRSAGYPKDFSSGWISFYGCRESRRFLANFHFPPRSSSGAVGWIWTNQDKAPISVAGFKTVMSRRENYSGENLLPVVSFLSSAIAIAAKEKLFQFSIVDELGPLLGNVVRLIIGNPVTRYYRAQARISPGQQQIEGILEVMNFE